MWRSRLIFGLFVAFLLTSCGNGIQNFNKRKYLKLKPLEPKEEVAIQKDSEEHPDEIYTEYQDEYTSEETVSYNEPEESLTNEVKSHPNEFVQSETFTEDFEEPQIERIDEKQADEEPPKYTQKARRYLTASKLLLIGGIVLLAITLGLVALMLTSNMSIYALFILAIVLAVMLTPAVAITWLALHFVRKSILYDELDKRERTQQQNRLYWVGFISFAVSLMCWLGMIAYVFYIVQFL